MPQFKVRTVELARDLQRFLQQCLRNPFIIAENAAVVAEGKRNKMVAEPKVLQMEKW